MFLARLLTGALSVTHDAAKITSNTTPALRGQLEQRNVSTARHASPRNFSALRLQVSAADLAVLESLAQHCACPFLFSRLETTCHEMKATSRA